MTLLIGWANSVKVCEVKRKERTSAGVSGSSSSSDAPDKYVEITRMFNISFCISGIASLKDEIILLVVDKDTLDAPGSTPQMMVVRPLESLQFEEVSSDILSPKGYQAYTCKDYHLESLIDDEIYFIVCPKDIILAKPREDDDHVAWLVERNRFDEALDAIKESRNMRRFTYADVGRDYMDFLIERGFDQDIDKAASLSPSICGTDKRAWDQVVKVFEDIDRLQSLAYHLPVPSAASPGAKTGSEFVLSHEVYEKVLKSLMKSNSAEFVKVIDTWPARVYDSKTVIHDAMSILQFDPANENLLKGLATIYTHEGRHDKALKIYLQIHDHKRVFGLISRYDLYSTLKEQLAILMQLNPEEASRLLIDNQEKISIEHVVSKLRSKPELLWVYLDQVIKRDPEANPEYHELLVTLYANHCPAKLLHFLKMSRHYSLEQAYSICKSNNLVAEMVFLLARMGNTSQALRYIINDLDDIDWGIEFCKDQQDPELWNDLISMSMSNPQAIRSLLSNIGTNIPDPISLMKQIPDDLKIDGLKDALVKILEDYRLQISLEERCQRVLAHDNFTLLSDLVNKRSKAFTVSESCTCSACGRLLMHDSEDFASDIIMFNCNHMFHTDCLPGNTAPGSKESCNLCTGGKSSSVFLTP
jgi:tetratricopeptide (TPR) repeat protein